MTVLGVLTVVLFAQIPALQFIELKFNSKLQKIVLFVAPGKSGSVSN